MSVVTLFTAQAPTLGGLQFDAILEDTLRGSVEYTPYPIESGANAVDHGIIQPFEWSLVGAVSNNPLRPGVTDFTGLLTEVLGDNGLVSAVAGMTAGLLSGSNETRASEALSFLMSLMVARRPFDIDTGDLQLSNMVIVDIQRTKTPSNETGLIFEATLRELATLDTVLTDRQPSQSQLPNDDPAKSQLAALINRGEKALADVSERVRDRVDEVLSI